MITKTHTLQELQGMSEEGGAFIGRIVHVDKQDGIIRMTSGDGIEELWVDWIQEANRNILDALKTQDDYYVVEEFLKEERWYDLKIYNMQGNLLLTTGTKFPVA